jgi:hypothetical protein
VIVVKLPAALVEAPMIVLSIAPALMSTEVRVAKPLTPSVPATVAFSSTVSVSTLAIPSRYRFLNSSVVVPKSMSLSVTGTIHHLEYVVVLL